MTDGIRPERRSRSFSEVAFGLLILAAIMGALLTALYFRIVRYRPVASLHLPPDTELAARLDVQNVVAFDPVRKNLLPLVNDLAPPKTPGLRPRLERLRERAHFELAADLREIVVARGSGADDWIVVLGGKFPSSGVVPAFAEVFSEEGQAWSLSADRRLLTAPSGVTIGQADDGALLVTSTKERALTALTPNTTAERLALNLGSAGSLSARGQSLAAILESLEKRAPEVGRIGRVERVTGELELGHRLQGRLVERFGAGTDVENARRMSEAAVRTLAKKRLAEGEIAGEGTALEGARASTEALGIVEIAFSWDVDAAQIATRLLADWVRRRAAAGTPAPATSATSP